MTEYTIIGTSQRVNTDTDAIPHFDHLVKRCQYDKPSALRPNFNTLAQIKDSGLRWSHSNGLIWF